MDDSKQRAKRMRLLKRSAWVLLALTILIVANMVIVSCHDRQRHAEYEALLFESPIKAQSLPEVDHANGYFVFSLYDDVGTVSGTVEISQELRTPSGDVLASRAYTLTMSNNGIVTDTMPTTAYNDPWLLELNENAVEWSVADWRSSTDYGEVVRSGQWYVDVDTPAEPAEDGWYPTDVIELYRVYLPLVPRHSPSG